MFIKPDGDKWTVHKVFAAEIGAKSELRGKLVLAAEVCLE